jgi:hypothetical protein
MCAACRARRCRLRPLLELQCARSRDFLAQVVGAFDGLKNDPASRFIQDCQCGAMFVQPQLEPFPRFYEPHIAESSNWLGFGFPGFLLCLVPHSRATIMDKAASKFWKRILSYEDRVSGASNHLYICRLQISNCLRQQGSDRPPRGSA